MTEQPGFVPRPGMRLVLLACLPGLFALLWQYGCGPWCNWPSPSPRRWPARRWSGTCATSASPRPTPCSAWRPWPRAAPWSPPCCWRWRCRPTRPGGWRCVQARAPSCSASRCSAASATTLQPGDARFRPRPAGLPAQFTHWPASGHVHGFWAAAQQVFGIGDGLVDGWSQATVLDSLRHNDRLTIDELFASHNAFGVSAGAVSSGSTWPSSRAACCCCSSG